MAYYFTAGAENLVPDPTYRRDPWTAHHACVETLCAAGIAVPPEWVALRDRYAAFTQLGNCGIDRLINAVITGVGDVTELRALALTEEIARSGDDSSVSERVRRAVLDELQRLYQPAALKNYRSAAARYDDAAKRFATAAKAIDVETSGETLLTAGTAQRDSWLSAPALAGDLDAAVRVLLAAAALAGAPPDAGFITAATDTATIECQIALATDPGKAHRRRVWEAWAKADGRTGRWGALLGVGVKLRAAGDPMVAPYKRPERHVAVVNPGGRVEYWCPHDGDLPRGWTPVKTGWMAESPSIKGIP